MNRLSRNDLIPHAPSTSESKPIVERPLVILPTYNEADNIAEILKAIESLPHQISILVVDDSSPDGTAKMVTDYPSFDKNVFLLKRPTKSGLGSAYREGFQWGLKNGHDVCLQMDSDFSHDPNDLIRLYNANALEGGEVAIGSRYVRGVNIVNWPMARLLMSFFASKYVKFITGMPIHDSTAGFKCYKRKVLETINFDKIQFVGYAFQIEMKFKAWKYGFNVVEVPVIFTDRTEGTSKMSGGIFMEAVIGVIQMKLKSFFRNWKR